MGEYPNTALLIDGVWRAGAGGRSLAVLNPATGERMGSVARAELADLEDAVAAAVRGFAVWRAVSAFERAKLMRQAASLLRSRAEAIAAVLTLEQGKPLAEARVELATAADVIEWFAGEAPRAYGRVVPARAGTVAQMVTREPVGPVAAFAPWNFPVNQVVRKIAAALAAGCSIIVKAAEETPAAPAALVRVFADAGIPAGVINLVFGDPAEISGVLIPHPLVRKITFTGSTAVGKQLAASAGAHMKRSTMELGGHAPVIVCADCDLDSAIAVMAQAKFRNAGQVCIAPTRFLVERPVYERFVDGLAAAAAAIVVGDGMAAGTTMGPLANTRRLQAMDDLVADAVAQGARLVTGGHRIGNAGFFFQPTVLADVPISARAMNEEPFGPLALVAPFSTLDEAIAEANRLPYGLAAYGFSGGYATTQRLAAGIACGMVAINHAGLGLPETPFGGVLESGYGSEGGAEAIESYLVTKFVTVRG